MKIPWYVALLATVVACALTWWITNDAAYDRAIDNSEIVEKYYYNRTELVSQLYMIHLLNEGSLQKLRDHLYTGIRGNALTLYIANPKLAALWHASENVPDQTMEWRKKGLELAFDELGKGPTKNELGELAQIHLSKKEVSREINR